MHVLYAYQHLTAINQDGTQTEDLKKLNDIAKHLLQNPTIRVNEPGFHGVSPLAKALECAVGDIIELLTHKGAHLTKKECRKQNIGRRKALKISNKH